MNNQLNISSFIEIDSESLIRVNGGIGPFATFALGVVGCGIAAGVDRGVKKITGKSISEHAWDLIK